MKKIHTLIIALAVSATAHADFTGSGYYRIKNFKSERYATVVDNRGSIDFSSTTADLAAIKLWRVFDDISHDPGSILYITNAGSSYYDLSTQSTSVYGIIGHYLSLDENGKSGSQKLYMAYGTYGKVIRYIGDGTTLKNRDRGYTSTNCTGDYRKWYILPVTPDGDNYIGAKPDVDAAGGLYTTVYASYPFRAYSEGVKLYYVSNMKDGCVELSEVKGTVPAGTPVVVECKGKESGDNRFDIGGSGEKISGNKLSGQYFNSDVAGHINRKAYDAKTMRVLGRCKDGSLGFVKASSLEYIPANSAYLVVPESYGDELKCVKSHEEFTSGIEEIIGDGTSGPRTVYTINGVMLHKDATDDQISSLPEGIYIISGKKVKI